MATYNIIYTTSNLYTRPVREATLELMVLPENNETQRCLSFNIKNSLNVDVQFATSLFGARLIRFRIPGKFCSFSVTVKVILEKEDRNPFSLEKLLPDAQDAILKDPDFKIDNFKYLSPTGLTKTVNESLPEESLRLKGEEPFLFMQRMNEWAHHYVNYKTGVTDTQTKLDEILKIREGVCQDYAHLFIACMRANGVPARYVSGYLDQGHEFTGNAAMHAWAEALLPGTGWIGFDPSNNLLTNIHYIKIGHGLDYRDCMPINGILIAKGEGTTEYSVQVNEQQTQ